MKPLLPILLLISLPLSSPGGGEPGHQADLWTTLPQPDSTAVPGPIPSSSFAGLVERASPAVVAIFTRSPAAGAEDEQAFTPFPFNPWQMFPESPRREPQEGIGSGFVIREDGYLVTNHHVVAKATSVTVKILGSSAALPARVAGSDPRSDLALLKVDLQRPLPVLPLGSSDDLPVGGWVVAIGNPFGLAHMATKGIVSGKGRTLGDLPVSRSGYFDFIQTDAAIDRGNSGGPLLNMRGEVVGINTAINSRARGISFAVPVDLAKAILPQLLEHGKAAPSYLGIRVDPVSWEIAESFGRDSLEGVVVTRVLPRTPAAQAGFREGDIILQIGGKRVSGSGDMGWRAATLPVDQPVAVQVFREGRSLQLQVTPIARGVSSPAALPHRLGLQASPAALPHRLGLQVADLDAKAQGKLPAGSRGVVVIAAEDDAATYGVRVGDLITSVNGKPVASKDEFGSALQQVKTGDMVRFYILRQKEALFVALPKRWE